VQFTTRKIEFILRENGILILEEVPFAV